MDMARKGIGSLLGTTHKVYRSSTTTVFRPRLATTNILNFALAGILLQPNRLPSSTRDQ